MKKSHLGTGPGGIKNIMDRLMLSWKFLQPSMQDGSQGEEGSKYEGEISLQATDGDQ